MKTETRTTLALALPGSREREKLETILKESGEFAVLDFNDCSSRLLANILMYKPDVVILDFTLPGLDSLELIRLARTRAAETKFLIYTHTDKSELLFAALRAGANGYLVSRDIDRSELLSSLQHLLTCGAVMSSRAARQVMMYFQESTALDHTMDGLTCRETEILKELSFGRNAKRIARQLNISYQTVRTHQKNIYRKLQVSSVAEAISAYRSNFAT